MSCSTREFGKCVKTQLQLVCSNYDSREFISISLLIKRDFLIWINAAHEGLLGRWEAGLCSGRMPWGAAGTAALEQRWLQPHPSSCCCRARAGKPPRQQRWLCQVSLVGVRWFCTGSSIRNNQTNSKPQTKKALEGTTLDAEMEMWPRSFALVKVKEHRQSEEQACASLASPEKPLGVLGVCSPFPGCLWCLLLSCHIA